jgi:Sulfotransferase family
MNLHPYWLTTSSDLHRIKHSQAYRKPNLFIIGSMKSGTTYLWSLLASHPSIFMSRPKEPTYFVEPGELRKIWPWAWEQNCQASEKNYLELFRGAETATILGEASVHYTYMPLASGVAERIYQFNPRARLIYLMRDPIERTISHYWHRVGWLGEHRSLSSAIKKDPQYRDVSYYAMQLAPYFRLFGRDQIKILTFEELIANPKASVASILKWLNLNSWVTTPRLPPENVTPDVIKQRRASWLLHGLRYKSDLLRALIDQTPAWPRRIGVQMVTREINRQSIDTSEIVQYLRPLQQRQTGELMRLLERDFPEWTTLNSAVV